jgi:hypothetical protein
MTGGGDTSLRKMRLPERSSAGRWLLPSLIALGCIAYVYRFPVGIGNASLFRLNGLIIGLVVAVRFLGWSARQAAQSLQQLIVPFCVVGAITLIAVGESAVRVLPSAYAADSLVQTINAVIFLLVFAFIDSRGALLKLIRAYVAVSFIEAGIAVEAFISGKLMFSELVAEKGADFFSDLSLVNESDGLRRLTGTFFDPNFYGIYLCTVVALASWLLLRQEGSRTEKIAVALSVVLIFLTASRTAMIGLCVVGAVLLVTEKRARRMLIVATLVVAPFIVGAFVLFSASPLLERILSGQSFEDRMAFAARGMAAFARSPILGSGTIALIDPDSGFATAHDVYLSVLGKFGIIGAGVYAAFIFSPVIVNGRNGKAIGDRTLAALCVLPLAGMYLSYDFFQFLEFQYVIYAIAYAAIFINHSDNSVAAPLYLEETILK